MATSEEPRRNSGALLADDESALKTTDPELIEVLRSWAFGEVFRSEVLHDRTRLMTQLAAIIACGAVNEYREMLGVALDVGVTPVEAKEIVYQAVPYRGAARVADFLHATNDVLLGRGVQLPVPGQSTTDPGTRLEKGLALRKRIFGQRIEQALRDAPRDLRHIQSYLSGNCFGDYYTRQGLDLKTRELLTFAMLAAMGGCEPQLAAHVAGNLTVGNDRRILLATLTVLLPFIGYPRTLNAIRIVDDGTSA